MGLRYDNLDEVTRRHMLAEVEYEIGAGELYASKWFTAAGAQRYPEVLRQAIKTGSDDSLSHALTEGFFMSSYSKATTSGGTTTAKVPHTAPQMFAEGEFNRFYLRGLCALSISGGMGDIEIYRARHSSKRRPSLEDLIGQRRDPHSLLADLRATQGVDTVLGLPPGPNSGLRGRLLQLLVGGP